MNGTVYPTAAQQLAVGCVDDRVNVLIGDVPLNDFNDTHGHSPLCIS